MEFNMKKIFFSLVFCLLAFQVNAASITLDESGDFDGFNAPIADPSGHSITLGGTPTDGVWETAISIVDVQLDSFIDFGAVIKNSQGVIVAELSKATPGVTLDLALDVYTVDFLGTPGDFSAGWSLIATIRDDVDVSAVPIPAAVWLFGSALMGLVGVSRRKSSVVA